MNKNDYNIKNNEISYELDNLCQELIQKLYTQNGSANNRSQGKILKILFIQDAVSQKELQDMLHIQPGTMTEIVAKLEKKGYVIRKKDDADHRRIVLEITGDGRKNVKEYHKNYHNSAAASFDLLEDSEKKELKRLFLKLLEK